MRLFALIVLLLGCQAEWSVREESAFHGLGTTHSVDSPDTLYHHIIQLQNAFHHEPAPKARQEILQTLDRLASQDPDLALELRIRQFLIETQADTLDDGTWEEF